MTPNPSMLTIERGQEMACSNITINDDGIVEMIEIFHVTVRVESSTFSAGVYLTQSRATIEIKDNDGELYMHAVKWFEKVRGGLMCLNYTKVVHRHPAYLTSSPKIVLVRLQTHIKELTHLAVLKAMYSCM